MVRMAWLPGYRNHPVLVGTKGKAGAGAYAMTRRAKAQDR